MRRNPFIHILIVLLVGIALGGAIAFSLFHSRGATQQRADRLAVRGEDRSFSSNAGGDDQQSQSKSVDTLGDRSATQDTGASQKTETPRNSSVQILLTLTD